MIEGGGNVPKALKTVSLRIYSRLIQNDLYHLLLKKYYHRSYDEAKGYSKDGQTVILLPKFGNKMADRPLRLHFHADLTLSPHYKNSRIKIYIHSQYHITH